MSDSNVSTKDQVAEAISTDSFSVDELVELTSRSESTVKKALKALADAGEAEFDEESGKWSKPEKKVRANHGYRRNTKASADADKVDAELIDFLTEHGPSKLQDIFEGTSCPTKRAAYHALWRIRR